jgi:hypothetical protein
MESVNVDRQQLLTAITENFRNHRQAYEEAFEGYRERMIEILNQQLDMLKKGGVANIQVFAIPVPKDHSKDYERAIKMLQMSEDDVINIDEHSFQCYVMDDWGWKAEFQSTWTEYSKGK